MESAIGFHGLPWLIERLVDGSQEHVIRLGVFTYFSQSAAEFSAMSPVTFTPSLREIY